MTGDELVSIVNEHDRVSGQATVKECLEKGLLHRAVAVLVMRSNGQYLLQQRSKSDVWHPGLWTISSTGHVKAGESYEAAAARELLEELGLSAKLVQVRKCLLPPIQSGNLTEKEWVSFYVARSDLPWRSDPEEVEAVKEVTEPQLRRMMGGDTMTPDAVILLTDYLKRQSAPK